MEKSKFLQVMAQKNNKQKKKSADLKQSNFTNSVSNLESKREKEFQNMEQSVEYERMIRKKKTMLMFMSNESNSKKFQSAEDIQEQMFAEHSNDFQLFAKLLDLQDDKKDVDALKCYTQTPLITNIVNLLQDEHQFRNFIINIKQNEFINFYEGLLLAFARTNAAYKMILKLKNLIKGIIGINQSADLASAFSMIVNQTCKAVQCDRASVFLIDRKRDELWTKLAKGTFVTIKVQLGQGLAGYVGKTGETINVLDAQQDTRFNKDADRKQNYKTKTVLCVPIVKNQIQGQIIGVLQAINKDNQGFFTKNDEGLIKIIAALAEPILRNCLGNDEKIEIQNQERLLFNLFKQLNRFKDLDSLIIELQKKLEIDFDYRQVRICIYDEKIKKFFYFDQYENKQIIDLNIGIVGYAFQNKKTCIISNCYNEKLFNSIIDIQTNMPVITKPIYHHKYDSKLIGVIQIVNAKGIENMVYQQQNDLNQQRKQKKEGIQQQDLSMSKILEETLDDICQIVSNLTENLRQNYFEQNENESNFNGIVNVQQNQILNENNQVNIQNYEQQINQTDKNDLN